MSKVHGSTNVSNNPERWQKTTEPDRQHQYLKRDGSYSYTIERGRNVVDGKWKNVYRTFRENLMDFGDRIEPGDKVDSWPGLGEEEPVLYKLPELIAAAASPGALVIIAEGEKDADTAIELGFTATCNPFGALKWEDRYSPDLAGCDVVIAVDNDARGRQHADQVAQSIEGRAARIRLLDLPDLPDKGDLTDWAVAKRADGKADWEIVDELKALIAQAPDLDHWRDRNGLLRKDRNGIPLKTQANIRKALALLDVKVSYDEFAGRMLIEGLPGFGPYLDDDAMRRLWLEVDARLRLKVAKEPFWDIVTDASRRNTFHPARDYFDSLAWDGTKRIDRWLIDNAGAEDTPFVRAASRIFLIAAVRRVRQPGCKYDEMLTLESPQGMNKSSALKIMAVKEAWFSDNLPLGAGSKEVIEQTRGHLILEAAELNGMRKGDVDSLKSFLSRQVDKARLSYGRLTSEVPRQWVPVGTLNPEGVGYLKDPTGNRRFWPVKVKVFDLDALRRDRDQLWAEAAELEAKGESIRLDPSLWGEAAKVQAERQASDPWIEAIGEALGDLEGKVKSEDLWTIVNIPVGARTQEHNNRLGKAMQALGWARDKMRFGGRNPEHGYFNGKWKGKPGKEGQGQRIMIERNWNESDKKSVLRVWIEEDM